MKNLLACSSAVSVRRRWWLIAGILAVVVLPGCLLTDSGNGPAHRRATSLSAYLYPEKSQSLPDQRMPVLRLPLRVGVAFVPAVGARSTPGSVDGRDMLTEHRKEELMQRMSASFTGLPFVKSIQIIPSMYLQPGGGFANLDQVAALLQVDVVALVSFDQTQVGDRGWTSISYWTVVGLYTLPTERNSTTTLLDAAVFDIASRRLLFRAPGTSQVFDRSTLVGQPARLRMDSGQGFDIAATNLVKNLQLQLAEFQQRVRENPGDVEIVRGPGYRGGAGAFGVWDMVGVAVATGWLLVKRGRATDR